MFKDPLLATVCDLRSEDVAGGVGRSPVERSLKADAANTEYVFPLVKGLCKSDQAPKASIFAHR